MAQVESIRDLPPVISNLLTRGQVFLSYPTRCPNCDGFVRLVGEHKLHGNWFCPVCTAYWAYDQLENAIPWEKRFWKVKEVSEVIVDKSPMSMFAPVETNTGIMSPEANGSEQMLMAAGLMGGVFGTNPSFPMNIVTGFLVPSFGYKIRRERKYLMAQAEDGTRTGRAKGGFKWGFELVFKSRERLEYDTLTGFWETQGFWLPFDYTDPFKGTNHVVYFDSKVEAEVSSFDTGDFSVTIVE